MSLWWLQPGWTETRCGSCGAMIYPEGDPDWGECYTCFSARLEQQSYPEEQFPEEQFPEEPRP